VLRKHGRRLVVAGWAHARAEFAACAAERDALRAELVEVKRERNELRQCLAELCTSLRRQFEAERETARLRQIQQAEREVCDPSVKLH
jgi:uncharacterized coiled-coil DUF342 family protein